MKTLLRGLAITLTTFLAMVVLLVFAVSQLNAGSEREQAAALKETVMRATLTCYAVEGRYPSDAEYLRANYGLVYDDARFIVSIRSFSDNLLPDIAVLTQGEAET